MEKENLQAKYIRFGLAIESGMVIWIEDSYSAYMLQRNCFASKFQFWIEGREQL